MGTQRMPGIWVILATVGLALLLGASYAAFASNQITNAKKKVTLQPASEFATIDDETKRSVQIFKEAGKVIQNPRCLNCHPVTRIPTQGDQLKPHIPPIIAGAKGDATLGIVCGTCHQSGNIKTFGEDIKSVPGHEHWVLAPEEMAWQGKTLGEICEQIKDKGRNGDRSLEEIHHHMAEDALVGWAFNPGEGRSPAPGNQKIFGELIRAWIDTGAHCPN